MTTLTGEGFVSSIVLKIFITGGLFFGIAACGNKAELNIPEAPPQEALQAEITAESLVRMGQRVEASGDLNAAGNFYADALDLDENLVEAHLGLGRILTTIQEYQGAAISYGNAHALQPEDYQIFRSYILSLLSANGQAAAVGAINQYVERNGAQPEVMNFLGIAQDLSGNFSAADSAFRQGLQLAAPNTPIRTTILGNLALSLGLSGKTSEAILLLNPFIGDMRLGRDGISPDQSKLRQNLALVYALSGNPDSAVEVAKSALSDADAEFNRDFYETVAGLSAAAKVRAVFLGELPEGTGP